MASLLSKLQILHTHPNIHDVMDVAMIIEYEKDINLDAQQSIMLTTTIVFRDEFFNNASFNAKYEYAAVGPEYLNPACGEIHAFGILLVVLDGISMSASALCKKLVNCSSNSSLSDEYHEPAVHIQCKVRGYPITIQ